jgi:hypothetical protein
LIFATEEDFTCEDRTALWTSWEKMVELSDKNREYKQKHFHYLWITRGVVQSLDSKLTKEDRVKIRQSLESSLSHGRGYFSARIYFGRKYEMIQAYKVWVKTRFPKVFAPKKHVGVGYGDHGTASNVASDGSPHWTEVASDRTMNPEEDFAFHEASPIWTLLQTHHLQRW